MRRIHTTIAAGLAVAACLAAACGSDPKTAATATPPAKTPQATATRTVGAVSSTPVPVVSETAAAITATAPVAQPTATLAPDRKFELAPIDGADLIIEESNPVQYGVHIVSGLPSGCAQFADATAARTGDEITITVRNTLPANGQIACTQIYGTHETTVQLGSDFVKGAAYRVHVNDRTLEFTAQ